MITSPHNPKLKDLRRLARRREDGRFVAEGEDLLAAADAAGWPALERYVAAGSGLAGEEVDPHVLAGVSGLGSGTRAIAVYEQRWTSPAAAPAVVLWGVRDPGNVGTVLRSAERDGEDLERADPSRMRWAMRCVAPPRLAEPTPATIRSGPSTWVTASRWTGFRPSRSGSSAGS